VNEKWRKAHPYTLVGPHIESLGTATCIRCWGRGRVTLMSASAR
jgi:hypothetical protein